MNELAKSILAKRKTGTSVSALSKEFGITTQRIYKILRENNVKRKYTVKPKKVKLTNEMPGISALQFEVSPRFAAAIIMNVGNNQ